MIDFLKKIEVIVSLLGILGLWKFIAFIFKKYKEKQENKKAKFSIRLVEDEIWITNIGYGEAKNVNIDILTINSAIFNNNSPYSIISPKNKVKLRTARHNMTSMEEEIRITWKDGNNKNNEYIDKVFY